MSRLKLKADVKLVPARNRVLLISDEAYSSVEGRNVVSLVGRLAPLISRGVDEDEISRAFDGEERATAGAFLEQLSRCGMVCEVSPGGGGAPRVKAAAPEITFVGHATLLIRTCGLNVLTDPWLFLRNKHITRPPYPLSFDDLPELDLICISHEHSDHFNLPTLMRLDKRATVVVPDIAEPNEFSRRLDAVLVRLGFERVVCLKPWESYSHGDLKVTRTPCHKAWHVMEQATWMFESPEMTLFCGNDMREDEPLMRRLGHDYDIDIAFLPISGYSHRIAELPMKGLWPEDAHEQFHRDVMGINEAVLATRWLKPKFAVGYANGGAYWYKHPEGSLTEGPAEEFIDLLRRENPSVVGLGMRPGDVLKVGTGQIVRGGVGE